VFPAYVIRLKVLSSIRVLQREAVDGPDIQLVQVTGQKEVMTLEPVCGNGHMVDPLLRCWQN
jgi:hypothetical protein